MNEEAHQRPSKPEITDDTPRQYPLIVPWTWGDYYAVRYLASTMKCKLSAIAIRAIWRGMRELARETVADHNRTGKFVPQRLALLALADPSKIENRKSQIPTPPHADPPP